MSAPPPPTPPHEITVRASIHAPPASSQGPPTPPKPSSDSGSDYGSPNYVSSALFIPSRISGRGYKIGPVCVCVCVCVSQRSYG